MRRGYRLSLVAGLFAGFFGLAAQQSAAALTGQVSSAQEPKMEGVIVSAKKTGSIVTVSVVSDASGTYRFPAGRLEPGEYSLTVRAVGYDLEGPQSVTVAVGETAPVNIKLKATTDLAAQLTNAEWLESVPGSRAEKDMLACVGCHTVERIVRSKHNAADWVKVITRMRRYSVASTPLRPQLTVIASAGPGEPGMLPVALDHRKQANYLASINLSAGETWNYPLKTLPRPAGRDTQVIFTEYDLPRKTSQPHDVVVDKQGIVWYGDFGDLFLGKLDPKTLRIKEYPIRQIRRGQPVGSLALELDPTNGTLWFDMLFQAALANFNPKTEKITYYPVPDHLYKPSMGLNFFGLHHEVDNKVWTKYQAGTRSIYRIDLATKKWEEFPIFTDFPKGRGPHAVYQVEADSENNLWLAEFLDGNLGRVDAKTGKFTWYTPPTPNPGLRRMMFDKNGVLLITESNADQVAAFDPKTNVFTEYPMPCWTQPYRAAADNNGEIWTDGMLADRVVRYDPKSATTVQYLLPRPTNMRDIFIDNATPRPTIWIGSNHGASIVKIEPLD